MDRYEIYFKLNELCLRRSCTNCPISFINSMWKWLWVFFRWESDIIIRNIEVLFYHIWGRKFEDNYRKKKGER